MFRRIYLVAGILAIVLFVHAQRQGWNLFDNEAVARGGHGGSGRVYHK